MTFIEINYSDKLKISVSRVVIVLEEDNVDQGYFF
jgi:hypothetical protein